MLGKFTNVDWIVLLGYFVATISVGIFLQRRTKSVEGFTAADRSLPGWALGLSMFGSYISSISFLANPGKAYSSNWNPFVFSLATPIAAAIAVRWFVPFYRRLGEVSAYEHLESRFGPWARTYSVVCFLLVQMARMGAVVYLLGLAMVPLTGWNIPTTVLVTGTVMTLYTVLGGIKAAVWTGVLQSAVLVTGILACLFAIIQHTPGGFSEIVQTGAQYDKFSLGSFGLSLAEPTFWVVLAYGLVINIGNFAVDQSYVQRYITAVSDREAKKSVWMTAILYVPGAAIFFFIGTGLFVFYRERPDLLGAVAKADEVFPYFISTQLPIGMAGLVVAAIFAASMDSNLSSMATLTYVDIYKRYFRPNAGERESLVMLRIATVAWGVLSTVVGLAMMGAESALDVWWLLAGIFSGGVLGLVLLGMMCHSANSRAGATGVVLGTIVIAWMTFSPSWCQIASKATLVAQSRDALMVQSEEAVHVTPGETVHLKYVTGKAQSNDRETIDESCVVAAVSDNGQEIKLNEPLRAEPTGAIAIFSDGTLYPFRSPFHHHLIIVFGTAVVLITGIAVAGISSLRARAS